MSLAEGPADDSLSLEAVVGADRAQLLLLGRCFGVVERHLLRCAGCGCYCTHAGWLQGQSHTERHQRRVADRTEQGSVNSDARHACPDFLFWMFMEDARLE